MPIFEYRCTDCDAKFEKLIRGEADAAALVCPSCGATHLSRELSTFSAHASSTPQPAQQGCASGMCPNAHLCGRN
jgi:putative FmdB family regulatory protein